MMRRGRLGLLVIAMAGLALTACASAPVIPAASEVPLGKDTLELLAKKGMVHVAKVMAATAVAALRDPALLAAAKADHAARTAATPYVCPIPDNVQPNVQPRPKGA